MSSRANTGGGLPLPLAGLFLVLSGAAALVYQVAWVRLLSLSVGSTSASVSTVLAAFFLGLAAGSLLAERLTRRRVDDLRVYAVLEVVIGMGGLLLLPALLNLDALLALLPALGTSLVVKFVVTLLLLVVPTAAMGATFPVLTGIVVRRQEELGGRIGALYALNTLGAVLGAGLSGFVLIPRFGLDGSVWIAVGLNGVVAVLALWAHPRLALAPIVPPAAEEAGTGSAPLRGPALVVLLATGFVSIAAEVGWSKYLAIFTGTTIYGFAAILTVFLVGIALGSWFGRARVARSSTPRATLAVGLLLLAAALLATRSGLALAPDVRRWINAGETSAGLRGLVRFGYVFLVLLPPTFLFGALFPLTLRLYCGTVDRVRGAVGRAYAWNTAASIVGSIVAGFFWIPRFGTDSLLVGLALGIAALPVFLRPRPALGGACLGLAAAAFLLPGIDYRRIVESVEYRFEGQERTGEARFLDLREGKVGVVSLVTWDGKRALLQSNGLKEALINLGSPKDGPLMGGLLALMPHFLHPAPRSAFVLGFGAGMTTRAFTYTDLERIRVVELEPAVVEVVRSFWGGEVDCLADPRVELTLNDARNTLLVEDERYDVIVSQPSHPWVAGAASLFSREFFTIARSRLGEGGVFAQWVALFNMDATTLRSILRAFYEVFPHGFTFMSPATGDLLLFGSERPVFFDEERIAGRLERFPEARRYLAKGNVAAPTDLLFLFGLSRDQALRAAGDVPANTDTNLLSEVRLARLDGRPDPADDPYRMLLGSATLDVLPYLPRAQAGRTLLTLGTSFVETKAVGNARVVLGYLERVAPELAGELRERIGER